MYMCVYFPLLTHFRRINHTSHCSANARIDHNKKPKLKIKLLPYGNLHTKAILVIIANFVLLFCEIGLPQVVAIWCG